MQSDLQIRIDRINYALSQSRREIVGDLKADHVSVLGMSGTFIDFNQGRGDAELEHSAFALIAEIASIKDHLKNWCKVNGKPFNGDCLIDSNVDVALIHDLWNTDKHATLSNKPRSGKRPQLRGLHQALQLSGGREGGSTMFAVNLHDGKQIRNSTGGGSQRLVVDGQIVDENGNILGGMLSICEKAIAAWESELKSVGAM